MLALDTPSYPHPHTHTPTHSYRCLSLAQTRSSNCPFFTQQPLAGTLSKCSTFTICACVLLRSCFVADGQISVLGVAEHSKSLLWTQPHSQAKWYGNVATYGYNHLDVKVHVTIQEYGSEASLVPRLLPMQNSGAWVRG